MGRKRVEPVELVGMNLERIGGTFTRAKNSSSLSGLRTMTARLSERPEMYGNGCDGSTARGVRTGKIRSANSFVT